MRPVWNSTEEVPMSAFIQRFSPTGSGIKLAVKDVIDMSGVITTAGSRAVAETRAGQGRCAVPRRGANFQCSDCRTDQFTRVRTRHDWGESLVRHPEESTRC